MVISIIVVESYLCMFIDIDSFILEADIGRTENAIKRVYDR